MLICPECGGDKTIGIEARGVYDGILVWQCMMCRHQWPRWSEGILARKGAEFIKKQSAIH